MGPSREAAMDRGIWVDGSGTAAGPRDECVVTLGAEVRRPGAAAALAAAAEGLAGMRGALLAAGIPVEGLSTSGVTLSPVYEDYPVVAGFQAAVQLTATTRDLGAVGQLLGDIVTAGGDAARVHDVSFRHSDATALLSRAREAAWADALARATQLAELAGRQLGEVLAVEESTPQGRPPGPMRMAAMDTAGGRMPLDAGEGAVVVQLRVGWALL